ncbi:hypothetical protein ACFLZB_00215 [Nanoarchaeota archaeon]
MDLSKLKREVEDLGSFDKNISLFNKYWIRSNTYDFLNDEDKEQLRAFRQIIKELKYGQVVNEKIISLANHLMKLQVHTLTGDEDEVKKARNKFLNDNQINIRKVIDEVGYIKFQLNLFKDFYEKIIYRLGKRLDLESNMALVDGKHGVYLKELVELNKKQQSYLKEIGSKFVQLSKKVKA